MVLVAGTIGAVGHEITQRLFENENYDKIIVWTHRELKLAAKS